MISALKNIDLEPIIIAIAQAVSQAGGRALIVGGYVRDALLGRTSKDLDLEIFGLSAPRIEKVLRKFGATKKVGAIFAVHKIKGMEVDIAQARGADYREAARHRDLTCNSMGLDPLTGELLDPFFGAEDLKERRLRACDAQLFGTDPLRVLRVARFAACLEMTPTQELLKLCRSIDTSNVAGERILYELNQMVLHARAPSQGLKVIAEMGVLNWLSESPRDVVDRAANLRTGDSVEDLPLMWAALLLNEKDIEVSLQILLRLHASNQLTGKVVTLLRLYRVPGELAQQDVPDKSYRQLARALQAVHVTPDLLWRMARAVYEVPEQFMQRMEELHLRYERIEDVVMGRDLLAYGIKPGPKMKMILDQCRDVQDETGLTSVEAILSVVLAPK